VWSKEQSDQLVNPANSLDDLIVAVDRRANSYKGTEVKPRMAARISALKKPFPLTANRATGAGAIVGC